MTPRHRTLSPAASWRERREHLLAGLRSHLARGNSADSQLGSVVQTVVPASHRTGCYLSFPSAEHIRGGNERALPAPPGEDDGLAEMGTDGATPSSCGTQERLQAA